MDSELRELKKQVTRITGWDLARMDLTAYLLTRLPKNRGVYMLTLYYEAHDYWVATYGGSRGIKGIPTCRSRRSPVIALLKLVIALDDAGVEL